MFIRPILAIVCLQFSFVPHAQSQVAGEPNLTFPVRLEVEPGTPLRLYITHRVSYRLGDPVEAKLIQPIWAYDRIVIPAGSTIRGRVASLEPVPKMLRAEAIVRGDFTPLKQAKISFTSLTLPDHRTLPLQTDESAGLATIYVEPKPPKKQKKQKKQKASSGKSNQIKQFLVRQAENQANARSHGLFGFVRGPNKREWLEDFAFSKLPYHPQWYRARTRFDAVLAEPLDFGIEKVAFSEIAPPATPVRPDAVGDMTLLDTISSSDAKVGDPMQGVLSAPLFTPEHKLLYPQGTRLNGRITLAQRARLFHRGGKLRFAIEEIQAPDEGAASATGRSEHPQHTDAQLAAMEADPKKVKVDSEGTATATESKTRLLRPAIAALVAVKTLDEDAGKQTASGGGSANLGGRSLGGFSGFGILGTIASRYTPPALGQALGFYGLAWSVYSTVVSRGNDVTFEKNAAVAIRFGNPPKK